MNIEILRNTDTFLHTHIWPRYEWEPEQYRRMSLWLYPSDRWTDPSPALTPAHDPLRAAITNALSS